jgi:hypothetical protein
LEDLAFECMVKVLRCGKEMPRISRPAASPIPIRSPHQQLAVGRSIRMPKFYIYFEDTGWTDRKNPTEEIKASRLAKRLISSQCEQLKW